MAPAASGLTFGYASSRLMRGWLPIAVLAAAVVACADESVPERAALPLVGGKAPLRRMSNDEYLNALRDLFPSQAPVLPPLLRGPLTELHKV